MVCCLWLATGCGAAEPNPEEQGPEKPGQVLWQAGQGALCTVTLPQGRRAKRVHPCNLRGEPVGEPFRVENDSFVAVVKPYAPLVLC